MGPRFFKRGERDTVLLTCTDFTSFNGATLFQAWRGCFANGWLSPRQCFNGATLFQAWRAP